MMPKGLTGQLVTQQHPPPLQDPVLVVRDSALHKKRIANVVHLLVRFNPILSDPNPVAMIL